MTQARKRQVDRWVSERHRLAWLAPVRLQFSALQLDYAHSQRLSARPFLPEY
ncbi:MAG: hypothetical protein DHS20C11_24310 [Lysobacteraceae bacterium]|nr:MAG: hypothetical protein DHS20C11_24310 [Xanthomonadaceae bacterium]